MKAKYMMDSYLREFDTTIKSVKEDKFVVLEDTIFYPNSGGQPNDTGILRTANGEEYPVVFVGKFGGEISHEVSKSGLRAGDKVKCILDWDRRYAHMKYHTAAHIVSGILHREAGALITGNQITEEKLRIDFNLEYYDKEQLEKYIQICNMEAEKDIEVKAYFMEKDKALAMPGMVKLANAAPPNIDILRIVEIPGVDMCADGGTHVKSTNEIGKIELIKTENKGKSNRRVYLRLI